MYRIYSHSVWNIFSNTVNIQRCWIVIIYREYECFTFYLRARRLTIRWSFDRLSHYGYTCTIENSDKKRNSDANSPSASKPFRLLLNNHYTNLSHTHLKSYAFLKSKRDYFETFWDPVELLCTLCFENIENFYKYDLLYVNYIYNFLYDPRKLTNVFLGPSKASDPV